MTLDPHDRGDEDEDEDQRDPLRAAFTDHERPPHDVVPHTPTHSVDDLRRLADGTQQVKLSHYELTADGITQHIEWITVTRPVIDSREETV